MLKNSLIPYVGYYFVCYILSMCLSRLLDKLGLGNFGIFEASILSAFVTSFLFFKKYHRAMRLDEQSKINGSVVFLLFLLGMLSLAIRFHLATSEQVTQAGKMSGVMAVLFGLALLFASIFNMFSLKLTNQMIEKNLNEPKQLIKNCIILLSIILIGDIIFNFIMDNTRH